MTPQAEPIAGMPTTLSYRAANLSEPSPGHRSTSGALSSPSREESASVPGVDRVRGEGGPATVRRYLAVAATGFDVRGERFGDELAAAGKHAEQLLDDLPQGLQAARAGQTLRGGRGRGGLPPHPWRWRWSTSSASSGHLNTSSRVGSSRRWRPSCDRDSPATRGLRPGQGQPTMPEVISLELRQVLGGGVQALDDRIGSRFPRPRGRPHDAEAARVWRGGGS